jgi:hypothetical protein
MIAALKPEFVEFIPEKLEDGFIYISEEYKTATHRCPCGCGNKVVTPLSPTFWRLNNENGLVSLYPSIGNWSFPCRSHYWIKRNRVVVSYDMSQQEIDAGRQFEARQKARHYGGVEMPAEETPMAEKSPAAVPPAPAGNALQRFLKWLFG